MAGNQTLVGEVPAIAVLWYQRYDTTRERDKTICCEMHQIVLCRFFFLFNWKIENQKGRICRITVKQFREMPWRIDRVLRLLMEMDEEALDCVYYLSLGVSGKAV